MSGRLELQKREVEVEVEKFAEHQIQIDFFKISKNCPVLYGFDPHHENDERRHPHEYIDQPDSYCSTELEPGLAFSGCDSDSTSSAFNV